MVFPTLRRDLERFRLRGLRRRRFCTQDRRLARIALVPGGLRTRCLEAGPAQAPPLRRRWSRLPFRPRVAIRQHPLRRASRQAGIEPSVGSIGDSYDNALAETIIGLFKTEVIHRRGPWRSLEAVEFAILEWIDWFNTRRLLESIGNIPPAEAEARYYAQTEAQALAA